MRSRLSDATTLLLAVSVLALCGCASDDDTSGPSTTSPTSSNPLFATWVMTTAANSRESMGIEPQPVVRWEFLENGPCGEDVPECPDGSKLMGNDGCNTFVRGIDDVHAETFTWGDQWYSTAVGCSGGLADAMFNVFNGDEVEYSVSGNELHVTSADGTVELGFQTADRRMTNN
jgi:hypothetical protein